MSHANVEAKLWLCPPCGQYQPYTQPGYWGGLSGECTNCGRRVREVHKFTIAVSLLALGECSCRGGHDRRRPSTDRPGTFTPKVPAWTVRYVEHPPSLPAGSVYVHDADRELNHAGFAHTLVVDRLTPVRVIGEDRHGNTTVSVRP